MAEVTAEFVMSQVEQGKKHTIVFLTPGQNRDQDETTRAELQMAHLRHLFGLMLEGKLRVNGPVMGNERVVGVSIYESADREEVERLVRADPAVVAGRLGYEIYEWFGVDGLGYPARPE